MWDKETVRLLIAASGSILGGLAALIAALRH